MKRLTTLLLSLMMTAALAVPVLAADYKFGSGNDTLNPGASGASFGGSTSVDTPVKPDPMSENIRRNKDAAFLPPPYGVFGGDIPTDPSSPYHSNPPQSGFVPVSQNLPPAGNENYAPGSSKVSAVFLPSTSQTATFNTLPWFYNDGTIGTLYVARTGKSIKVYEGEELSNLAKGAGHFALTSA